MRLPSSDKEKALLGKEKHRVLIFGQRTYGTEKLTFDLEFCDVEQISDYRKLKKLSEYTLIIVDYSVFLSKDGKSVYRKEQEIFQKQMHEALDSGSCFCFLHYEDKAPRGESGVTTIQACRVCLDSQIGYRCLEATGIQPIGGSYPFNASHLKRNEFKRFMDGFGASKVIFEPHDQFPFSDVIAGYGRGKETTALGFSLNVRRGRLIYLPFQRDFSRPEMLREGFKILIDSLITYLTRSRMELPEWAKIPIFDNEEILAKEKADLESKVTQCQKKLDIFDSAKQLLFQSEYGLEEALPRFLQQHCKMSVEREETYREDFWLLAPDGEKLVICEVKSYVKGFRKSGLFNLYNHRESYSLGENSPAVLFVNTNLNAASWKEKDKPIDKQDYKEAAHKHVLILRMEDLVFAWQGLQEEVIDENKLLSIFRDEVGWLHFKSDKSWEVLSGRKKVKT